MDKIEKLRKKKKRKKEKTKTKAEFDYSKMPLKEFQKIGVLNDNVSYTTKAGLRANLSYKVILKSLSIIKICALLTIITTLGSVYFIYQKPAPLLLLSYPDGSVKCPLNNFDINTGKNLPRTQADENVCKMLEQENIGVK